MDYTIISFYTGHYQWDAEQLIKSMEKLGMKNYQVEYRDRIGDWARNTQMKAPFILEKLKENETVVWTDADSRVRQIPKFFDTVTTDIAVFYLPKELAGGFTLPEHAVIQDVEYYLQSGTMYFKNNERVIKLLERWIELNNEDPSQWDQWTLQKAILESDVSVTQLPPDYVWMDGVVASAYDNRAPVFEHTQASRRFKDKIR
jgi:hypothetical protein